MPRYVRFEEEADVDWLLGLMERAMRKMTQDTTKITDENVECVPRILEALKQAGDIKEAVAMGVPKKVIKEDQLKDIEKKKARKAAAKKSKKKVYRLDLCKDHPYYSGQRRISRDCQGCWDAYRDMNPLNYEKARRDFERTLQK